MPSGADLFVVCKKCGSEVSPYITECPYCGHRLRRRAPDLPREKVGSQRRSRRPRLPRLGRTDSRRYVTIALVAVSCVVWVVLQGGYIGADKLMIIGPLGGDWWK